MVRLKNRYFLCEIVFAGRGSYTTLRPEALPSLKSLDIHQAVKSTVGEVHGDYGVGAVTGGLHVKYVNPLTNMVLIRVRRDVNKILWSSLPFVKMIGGCDCFLNTIHIGGTIRSCQKSLVKYNRQQLDLLLKQCKTEEERRSVQESIKKCSLNVTESGAAFITKETGDKDSDEDLFDEDDSDSGD